MEYKEKDPKEIIVIHSNIYDPIYNLAYEAYLTETVVKDKLIIFLWQNSNTIVVGRNQNPWKECQVKKFLDENGRIIRRLSGGGAVYHDLGNLNFSLIANKEYYNVPRHIEKIKESMSYLGLNVAYSGKNDLSIDGKKFSGHAFFSNGENKCHHGSILINTNLKLLGNYLTPSKLKIKTKSVDSVRARVMNLVEADSNIDVKAVGTSIAKAFLKDVRPENTKEKVIGIKEIEEEAPMWVDKFKTWSWTYAEIPSFDVTMEKRFNWGTIEVGLLVKNSQIKNFQITTDSNETQCFFDIMSSLEGMAFEKELILETIENIKSENLDIIRDFKLLLLELLS